MEIFIAVICFAVVSGLAAFLGYLAGCFKRADYFSEQLKVAEWQRDQAIHQRDQMRAEIGKFSEEVNQLWAQGRRD